MPTGAEDTYRELSRVIEVAQEQGYRYPSSHEPLFGGFWRGC
jgi:hypothetical protein